MSNDDLTVLLVEDNPGDARLIREMLREGSELAERAAGADELSVRRETRLDDALEQLAGADADGEVVADAGGGAGSVDDGAAPAEEDDGAAGADEDDAGGRADGGVGAATPSAAAGLGGGEVDVVLLDLDLPDSTGLDTLAAVVETTDLVPIIVLTGLADREVGIQAIERGAQDYLVKDDVTADLLGRSIHYAIERTRQEAERERRRRQLESLNRHNRIAQDVTHAVITSATREELERAVCDRLVDSDGYRFAWFGDVDRGQDAVTPRVAAGDGDGYLEEVAISVEGGETAAGPTGTAARTGEVQVVEDARTDPGFEPWRETALEHGFRSSAAIPIAHEELLYGVLNVYAGQPDAFAEPEVEILSRLGDVVGHAISALERKDALRTDTVLELQFGVDGVATPLTAATADHDGAVAFDSLIQTGDAVLAYGEVEGVPRERFLTAAEETEEVDDCRVLGGGETDYEVELVVTAGRDLFEALPTHGGSIAAATVAGGEVTFSVEFPQGRDTRRLIELVEEHCPQASLQAQRTRERATEGREGRSGYRERLTEKQWTALETAYEAGHFEWPRETSGEELAERLGVSPATFHEHLRSAERKVFERLVEGE